MCVLFTVVVAPTGIEGLRGPGLAFARVCAHRVLSVNVAAGKLGEAVGSLAVLGSRWLLGGD